jgi:hypothetical protein
MFGLVAGSGIIVGTAVAAAPQSAPATEPWTVYEDRDGIVSSYRGIPGSKVLAARGEVVANVEIAAAVAYVLDPTKSTEWVDMLVDLSEHERGGGAYVERQTYDMPWPTWDREFVLRRTVSSDAADHSVTVTYASIDDAQYPARDGVVRGRDSGS